MPIGRLATAAVLAAAATGCAIPDQGGKALRESPVHGNVSLELLASEVSGGVAMDGFAGSTDGSEWDGGGSVLVDVLGPRWLLSFESGSHGLPDELDLDNGTLVLADPVAEYKRNELFLGVALVSIAGPDRRIAEEGPPPPARFRLDALAGGRMNTLEVDEITIGGFEVEEEQERWIDALAGVRAEWRISESFLLRGRGDTRIAGESDAAWSARVSVVYGPTPGWAVGAGWEARSVDFESGSGSGLDRFDVHFSGPFLALELLF